MIKITHAQRAVMIKALREARATWNNQAVALRSQSTPNEADIKALSEAAVTVRDLAEALEDEQT